jgi:hypothetical protein
MASKALQGNEAMHHDNRRDFGLVMYLCFNQYIHHLESTLRRLSLS